MEVANNDVAAATVDVWVQLLAPGGNTFPILGPIYGLTLAAGESIDRDRTVLIPGGAPAGEYLCQGFIGSYPWMIIDSSSFGLSKAGIDGCEDWSQGWLFSGEPFPCEGDNEAESSLPSIAYKLIETHPNPFNPEINLCFSLPEAQNVSLIIYDIQGREVVRLVDDWLSAGIHERVWNAAGFPSGVYFARLTAGEFHCSEKAVIDKISPPPPFPSDWIPPDESGRRRPLLCPARGMCLSCDFTQSRRSPGTGTSLNIQWNI